MQNRYLRGYIKETLLNRRILTISEVCIMVEAYCMKCKTKREMANAKPGKMKNGRDCVTGKCSKCGTKMFKIGKA